MCNFHWGKERTFTPERGHLVRTNSGKLAEIDLKAEDEAEKIGVLRFVDGSTKVTFQILQNTCSSVLAISCLKCFSSNFMSKLNWCSLQYVSYICGDTKYIENL